MYYLGIIYILLRICCFSLILYFSLLYKNALLAHPKLHFWQLVKK